MQIAIDGPVGSGKSTIARKLGKRLGILHVDTGKMYRALGVYVIQNGLDPGKEADVLKALETIDLEIKFSDGTQKTIVNQMDISDDLESNEAGMLASQVSKFFNVRAYMVEKQQEIAAGKDVVLDGRDIGTVVLPAADFKFFISASIETRAKRRMLQLEERGEAPDFESLVKDIKKRDFEDMNRVHGPLQKAPDGILIMTDEMTIEAVLNQMLFYIETKKKVGK